MDCCSPRYFINDTGFLQACPKRKRKSFCQIVTPSFLFASNASQTVTLDTAELPVPLVLDENVTLRGFIASPDFTQFASQNSGIYNATYDLTIAATAGVGESVVVSILRNGEPIAGTEQTIVLAATPERVTLPNFPLSIFSGQVYSLAITPVTGAVLPITLEVTNASLYLNRIANLGGS
ncbi:hypothetical protein AJ85_16650 [Alkalihalobacillus alcalophilus ATCC 27647 = CGMCC 1.3604]|uniref:BclA C-terminal domain-containing protein n=1 Tax=Alkalihalobacillus alcalophilus ATCC 27647 = CGMCC 1.3604 TaxID=1218173 RepID=A0A094WMY1_ALKAL|nr:hypothetical protein [Alkalihalobacillus alcalophilus]KGA97308.1 hypothetical protein BALCAV_0210885 [Alkalihalobacillus alcalophilus ATCC 27647 = CGMCC 1.3604]MED1562515.1 hypothetical protein [Alkalihalobacillus alcalophilus]THG92146.1 hypothetical protein AJ85_16650 [Alkalihalobacillus alcalophilus ATCC 27647 = CGMCC 1.3604]